MNEIYTDLEDNNNTKVRKVTTFATGAVRDVSSSKEDYVETISYLAIKRYAEYMTAKQSTYGRGNWRKGIPVESYEKSLMRHLQKYFANKYDNAGLEPNEDHLAAAMFNLQGLLHEEEKNKVPTPSLVELLTPVQQALDISIYTNNVIKLMKSNGRTNAEIADTLGVSERTIYRRLKELKNG